MRVAFEVFEGDVSELKDYEHISGHLIFDIKLGENFRHKARFVADGYKASTPSAVTYSSVASRDSVRLYLLIAALTDSDVQSADESFIIHMCIQACISAFHISTTIRELLLSYRMQIITTVVLFVCNSKIHLQSLLPYGTVRYRTVAVFCIPIVRVARLKYF